MREPRRGRTSGARSESNRAHRREGPESSGGWPGTNGVYRLGSTSSPVRASGRVTVRGQPPTLSDRQTSTSGRSGNHPYKAVPELFSALFSALCSSVRHSSPPSVGVRHSASGLLTCKDEPRRTSLDGPRNLAKVGVAGSNPVVRSKNVASHRWFCRSRKSRSE